MHPIFRVAFQENEVSFKAQKDSELIKPKMHLFLRPTLAANPCQAGNASKAENCTRQTPTNLEFEAYVCRTL